MRLIVSCLSVLVLCLLAPSPAAAREEPLDSYGVLDTWLRAEQLEQRCHMLNYFEIREIDRGINNAKDLTKEGKAVSAAAGQSYFEIELEKMVNMVEQRRETARLAVADRPCDAGDADIRAVRGGYIRNYLKALIAAQQSQQRQMDRSGRKRAGDQLLTFVQSLYGQNYEAVGQQLIAELQAEGYDANVAWEAMKNPINDGLWQMRLGEKGFAYQSDPEAHGYYRAVRTDGSGTAFPARLGHRFNPKIRDADWLAIEINEAEGVMDDGRLVILISKDASDWGPKTLGAQLLVQDEREWDWDRNDWRAGTLRFDATLLEDAECPADFCFVFPQEATEAIVARQALEKAYDYNYELVITAPNQFPLSDEMSTYGRDRYYPPSLTKGAGD
nr:hypothetical protein [uncultured Hyphomonas sp.]